MSAPSSSHCSTRLLGHDLVRRGEVRTRLEVLLIRRDVAAMRRQVALHEAFRALDERHAVIAQDLLDFVLLIVEREFEHVFEEGVGLAHADGEIELERHGVVLKIDRQDGRAARASWSCSQPANGSEHAGDIEIAVRHVLHRATG